MTTMDAFETTVPLSLADTDRTVRDALANEGFGVLTEIDVAATLRAKLGVERPPLMILGACNPTFANRALELDPSVALVLPCNVTLEPGDGGTRVRVIDPRALMDDPRFASLAEEAAGKLRAAISSLSARASA
jgi:uncharacterized protein (DUF302 family)